MYLGTNLVWLSMLLCTVILSLLDLLMSYFIEKCLVFISSVRNWDKKQENCIYVVVPQPFLSFSESSIKIRSEYKHGQIQIQTDVNFEIVCCLYFTITSITVYT